MRGPAARRSSLAPDTISKRRTPLREADRRKWASGSTPAAFLLHAAGVPGSNRASAHDVPRMGRVRRRPGVISAADRVPADPADRARRRPLALAAFGAITGARSEGAIAAATALVFFFAIRCGQVIVSGGLMAVAQALHGRRHRPERRASGMGLLGAAYGLGVIVGAAVAWRTGGRSSAPTSYPHEMS